MSTTGHPHVGAIAKSQLALIHMKKGEFEEVMTMYPQKVIAASNKDKSLLLISLTTNSILPHSLMYMPDYIFVWSTKDEHFKILKNRSGTLWNAVTILESLLNGIKIDAMDNDTLVFMDEADKLMARLKGCL